ncbi:hypothetical protein [Neobacillus sp. 114]|uniref:hypothetical protein n=1 Tax=Neobacillus sp. 114 TaxID=3048535 RepID=UPI0024C40E18|nr:hypothetical protein [Neobacillus sp. 114]
MATERLNYSPIGAPIRVIGYPKPELFTYWGANTAHWLPRSRIIQQFGHQYESLVTESLNYLPIGAPIRVIGYPKPESFTYWGANTAHWLPRSRIIQQFGHQYRPLAT